MVQVTDDHSLAEERMRHGEMTEAEAAVHPQRHILTRALGVSSEVETDMWELHLRTGDRVLLCSDGLSNEVDTDEMAQVLGAVADPDEAAQRLVDVANANGGADNITVVIVDVQVGEDVNGSAALVTPIGSGDQPADGWRPAVGGPVDAAVPAEATGAPDARRRRPAAGGRPERRPGAAAAAASTTTALIAGASAHADDTLAPGAQLGFGDEPTRRWPRPARAATSSSWARRPPCRWPAAPPASRPSPAANRRAAPTERRRAGAPAAAAWAFPGGSPSGSSGFVILVAAVPVGGLFRAPLVRLRQLGRDHAGHADRGQAGPAGRRALVPPQGGGPLAAHARVTCRPSPGRPCTAGVQKSSLAKAKSYINA